MHTSMGILADLPSLGINPNEWTAGSASAIAPWIAGGVGMAVVIAGVMVGWKALRSMCDPEYGTPYEGYTYENWMEDAAEDFEREQAVDAEIAEYAADQGDAAVELVELNAEMGQSPITRTETIDPDDLVPSADPERMTDAEIEEWLGEGAAGTDSLVDDGTDYPPEAYENPANHPDDPSQEVF